MYVLDPHLQNNVRIPKWQFWGQCGVHFGISRHHSSSVHLVLNPATGAISPQYHCIFDDNFFTVTSYGQFNANLWSDLLHTPTSIEIHPALDGVTELPPDAELDPPPLAAHNQEGEFETDIFARESSRAPEGVQPQLPSFDFPLAPEGASEGGSEGIPILPEGVPCDSAPPSVPNHLLDPPVPAPSVSSQPPNWIASSSSPSFQPSSHRS